MLCPVGQVRWESGTLCRVRWVWLHALCQKGEWVDHIFNYSYTLKPYIGMLRKDATDLSLVPDEVDLWLAGLCRRWCRNRDLWLLIGLLDQDVDECLLFVLWDGRDVRDGWWRWCGSLDEHYLVVLLWGWWGDGSLGGVVGGLWGRYVDVDVLVDDGGLLRGAVHRCRATAVAAPTPTGDRSCVAVQGESTPEHRRLRSAQRDSHGRQQLRQKHTINQRTNKY